MSTLLQYIGDTGVIARFRVRQLRVAVIVLLKLAVPNLSKRRALCFINSAW